MHRETASPSTIFFENYKDNILECRSTLFKELDSISPQFANEARLILETKLKSSNNPQLGELFPWIIKDLTGSDTLVTHRISVGWLAIYLYTLFLDEYVDNPKPLSSTKFIAGSLLAKTGLLKISRFTYNTPFENFVENALTYSAVNQHLDVQFQKKNTEIDFKKKYSEGKNYIVLACAGALAAQNSKYSEFIIQFTKRLLLTFQYLDDLGDYYSDFNNNNYTVLLNDAFKHSPDYSKLSKSYSKNEILSILIESGALKRVVNKVVEMLDQSIALISENNLFNSSNEKSSIKFLSDLRFQCDTLDKHLISLSSAYKSLPRIRKGIILDKIERQLIIIAEGT